MLTYPFSLGCHWWYKRTQSPLKKKNKKNADGLEGCNLIWQSFWIGEYIGMSLQAVCSFCVLFQVIICPSPHLLLCLKNLAVLKINVCEICLIFFRCFMFQTCRALESSGDWRGKNVFLTTSVFYICFILFTFICAGNHLVFLDLGSACICILC